MTSRHTTLHSSFVAMATLLLIGCGGGGGGGGSDRPASTTPPAAKNASPGGIWKGTASSGQSLVGIVTETGEFTFVQDDGVQYFCNMSVSADKVSAGFTGIAPFGTTFDTGSSSGGGSLSGTIVERSSMSGSIEFTAAAAPTSGSGKVSSGNPAEAGTKPCGAAASSLAMHKSGLAPYGTAAAAFARQ